MSELGLQTEVSPSPVGRVPNGGVQCTGGKRGSVTWDSAEEANSRHAQWPRPRGHPLCHLKAA